MKVKPKEIQVNLPSVFKFKTEDEIHAFASNINSIIAGKVLMKYEELGSLGGELVAIFYLQRNNEFSELRESFMKLIEKEEIETYNAKSI